MQIQFAGVGSAFTTQDYWQSNLVIRSDKEVLLIDCGGDARFSLKEINITHRDINAVYISHLHADHIGGLEWLGFCTYFDPSCKKPKLYIVKELIEPLWESLKAGMQSHEGVVLELSSFFDICPIEINDHFVFGGAKFFPVQTVHVMNGFGIVNSYGLFIEHKASKIFLTTDTQFCPRQIEKFYAMADLIFQDCETGDHRSGIHAHYDDLKTLDKSVKEKMWLYHYNPNPKQKPHEDKFCGFVRKGSTWDL